MPPSGAHASLSKWPCLDLYLHDNIITYACLNVHSNVNIKRTMIEQNIISIFPQSKQNLHPEGMPNLSELSRDSGRIAQDNHMPRERFRPKWLEKVMNPLPVIMSMPAKLEDMQERLWLSTNRASRVWDPNVLELRAKGKTLEG